MDWNKGGYSVTYKSITSVSIIKTMGLLDDGLLGGYFNMVLLDVSPDGDSIDTKFPGCLGLIPTTLL